MPKAVEGNGQTVVVIGAGIIGLTTALALAQTGFRVTIIEQNSGACLGASKANAGQLLYDRIGAMGSPGFLRSLPKTVLDHGQGVSVLGLAKPANWRWSAAFLRQCTSPRWKDNTGKMLAIAARSRRVMADLQERYALEFNWRKPGKLIVYPTQKGLDGAAKTADYQSRFGGNHRILTRAECLDQEPALHATTREIAGGVYLPDAEVADCCKFGQEVAALLADTFDVQIKYGVEVLELERKGTRITAARYEHGLIKADLFVLATGKAAGTLLKGQFARKKPITAVKGLSLTFPIGAVAPDMSVTDASGKFVVLRLADKIRVAGYALFADGPSIKPEYVEQLTAKARALMPQAAQYDGASEIWVGTRPQTPDDLPMIGQADAANLFVNAGHGSLGWTLALGSAEVLLEKVTGSTIL